MVAAAPKPSPPLFQLVHDGLKTDPKLRRVKAYTAGGTVTLYGKVFDDDDKQLAERTVRGIPGVTGMVDTLTTDTAEWTEQQDKITRALQNAGLDKVTVKVIGRDAYLNGQVKTALERTRAVTVAEGAAPVTVRENLIGSSPATCSASRFECGVTASRSCAPRCRLHSRRAVVRPARRFRFSLRCSRRAYLQVVFCFAAMRFTALTIDNAGT